MSHQYYPEMRDELRRLGIDQDYIAEKLDCSRAHVSHLFNGKTEFRMDQMYVLMKLIHAKPEELHIYFPQNKRRYVGEKRTGLEGEREKAMKIFMAIKEAMA